MWKIAEALQLVNDLQRDVNKVHWNVVLGGSVLYKGKSDKDLDLVFFPFDTSLAKVSRLQDKLEEQGWTRTHNVEQMWAHWRHKGSNDRKHVEIYRTEDGKRIDVFILA